ncbi:cellulose biosynthesis cyclic di-GMP-binding regulatory protein BcsB [Mycolicibacterium iranicum]|uniref:cellulose biosynthesis cyclic di-GMP-binding regulatory protein BcsB n=1 Tax=Mycolicibacterium iranicum TaxID=912594 RepID=UPI001F3A0565|nr:cellulose biosynthesis cyclic di-GMP-binding regulatory protein BcsB [Mycolicibacterium iranicum]
MSRSVVARVLASVMLLIAPIALAGAVAGSASAQPDDGGEPAGLSVPWATLGLQSTVNLYGDGESTFSVEVPAGLTATRLRGMIHTPLNFTTGYVEINDAEGNFVASIEVPPVAPGLVMAPFDVDITSAVVRGSSMGLTFAIRARDDGDRVCDPLPRLELSNLETVFVGAQLPVTTVANFFAPVLERITIYVATDATSAEQQAVLTLSSALARLYASKPLAIGVVSQPRGTAPPPAAGLDRAILVETGDAGLSVENAAAPNAYLRISGDDEGLSEQVSLIASQLQPLAQAGKARVDQAGSPAAATPDTMTFKELNVGSEKTDVLGTNGLQVGIQRTSLGPRFNNIKVNLLADYTPIPERDAASIVIRAEGLVVYRAPLDESGHLDATFELNSTELQQQWIDLEFALTYTPEQACGPLVAPITFQIDPRSTLTMQRGGPPLGGFGAFPSEFSPDFLVAFDGSGPNQLDYAARAVASMARLNKAEITPQVVDLATAADATSGALIVANADSLKQTSLSPPVSGDGSIVNFALPSELKVDLDGGLGSIQAFADPQRNRSVVLVTTTSDWSLVAPLFSYIDGSTGDWSQLTGDVLAAGAAGTPTNVAIRTADSVFEPALTAASGPARHTSYVVAGVVAALIVVVWIAYLVIRRRRNRSTDELAGNRSTTDSH